MDRTWYWGNITAYNGWEYKYQGGRQLASATNGSTTLNFTYNDAGLRTSKTGHTNTYNGSLLASDVTDDDSLYFRYDQNGAPIGFAYKTGSTTTEYYYLKNLQGDITGIVDTSGNRVATYVYDAWGNHLSITGSNTDLANKNPLRYRGYQFDSESGLYYLQSRYYSPAIGRFISADNQIIASNSIGTNLFAYCMNNPVFFADYSGESVALPTTLLYGASLLLLSIFAFTTADPNVQSGMQNSVNSFVDKIEKTATKAVQWLMSALSEGEALTSIAQQYGTYQCKQAAEAMKKANNNGKIVELYFPGAYNGYVVSDRYSYAISETGYHYGYMHNGIVRCNVYPEGLPLPIWIQRFDATGPAPQIRFY